MYGAALGDIIGSPYEFNMGLKTKDFPLFITISRFTDDTVMTAAIAEALLNSMDKNDVETKQQIISSLQRWGKNYPNYGYGNMFQKWLISDNPKPYNSYGNGSAMRVSPVAWLYDDINIVRHYARITAEVTHNHPEGIKGAEAVASAILMARTGCTKNEIKDYIEKEFKYDLSRTCADIRPTYKHIESCQETVPEAIITFLESNDFIDAIRNAISLGGDTDTLGAITGSIAEAFYGIDIDLLNEIKSRLSQDITDVFDGVYAVYEQHILDLFEKR